MRINTDVFTYISMTGRFVISLIREAGAVFVFFYKAFVHIFSFPLQISKIVNQIYFIGVKSVVIVGLTGTFTGMVLGLQGYYSLVKFGAEGTLGAVVALSIIRELGPVLAAIMVVGRAGSAIAAEIGIMRISEQIDALETMDIDPIRFLVSPKLAAAMLSMPLLTALFDVMGILGGYLTGSVLLGVSSGIFFSRMESNVMLCDVTGGFYKAFVFGIILTVISCYKGFYVHKSSDGFGAKGVSTATTSAVVLSSVFILVVDYVLTSFLI